MGDTQAGEEGRCGAMGRVVGAKRSLKHTGARPVDGARRGRGEGERVQGSGKAPRGRQGGIVDAPAGRIGSEGSGTASALNERSYRTAGFS